MTAVVRAEPRFRARRRAHRQRVIRRRVLRPALVMAIAVTIVGGAAWSAWSSPLLALRTVTVEGTSRLSSAAVLAAADVPVGRSLLRVDPGRIRARILAALPAARSVSVDRDWPHRLVITVTERRPIAVVAGPNGVELVDAEGVAFAAASVAPPGLLPLTLGAAVPGPGDADARAALAVWSRLPPPLRAAVVGISAASPVDVTLRLTARRTVVWGDPGEPARKAAALRALMAHPASTYDVSTPDVPVTKP